RFGGLEDQAADKPMRCRFAGALDRKQRGAPLRACGRTQFERATSPLAFRTGARTTPPYDAIGGLAAEYEIVALEQLPAACEHFCGRAFVTRAVRHAHPEAGQERNCNQVQDD